MLVEDILIALIVSNGPEYKCQLKEHLEKKIIDCQLK